ncbi:hypothetical protein BDZ97DRAFT_1819427 [Flammula alnicola]|nr:hypothetical protein BDZ97DRAFT_1819427 [Flammula alnicola]
MSRNSQAQHRTDQTSPYSPSDAPIYKLNPDVLLQIFFLNTDYREDLFDAEHWTVDRGDHHGLNNTLYSFQVCRLWRGVILLSRSLWGRCIDLNDLRQVDDKWRNEILLRSGESPLSVTGRVNDKDTGLWRFFTSTLLNDHWTRIRRLSINVKGTMALLGDNEIGRAFSRPSQRLEYFRASFDFVPLVLSTPELSFFSDNAPSLSAFSFKSISIRLQVPWLSQLQHLGLSSTVTVPELLERLKDMLLMETLDLDLTASPFVPITSDAPNITLPRLRYIRVAGAFDMCTLLLEHISPSPGCALTMDSELPHLMPNHNTTFTEVDYRPLHRVLPRYSQSYLDRHIATSLSLFITDASFPKHARFEIGFISDTVKIVMGRRERSSPDFLSAITDSFSSSHRAKITTIDIVFRQYDPYTKDNSGPLLFRFFLSFGAITTLKCHPRVLQFLLDISNGVDVVFPLLRTLKMKELYILDESHNRSFIAPFIAQRQAAGMPIEDLDLTKCEWPLGDVGFLEEATGLKVLWRYRSSDEVTQYICGSGKPETLSLGSADPHGSL